jgi:hypothetical protein
VICDLTAHRTLDGRPLRTYAQLVRHQRYDRTTIRATDGDQTSSTHPVCGHLRGLGAPVTVLQSRRHPRDHHPKYLLCTDRTVPAQEILTPDAARQGYELDYSPWGVEDFRVRPIETYDTSGEYGRLIDSDCCATFQGDAADHELANTREARASRSDVRRRSCACRVAAGAAAPCSLRARAIRFSS